MLTTAHAANSELETIVTGPAPNPERHGAFTLLRFDDRRGLPVAEIDAMLKALMHGALRRLLDAGGVWFDPDAMVATFWRDLDTILDAGGRVYVVADVSGTSVGMSVLRRCANGEGIMKHLYVMPEFRSLGLGRVLVDARVADARQMNLSVLRADTLTVNPEMQGLYTKLGFERDAIFEGSALAAQSDAVHPYLVCFRMAL